MFWGNQTATGCRTFGFCLDPNLVATSCMQLNHQLQLIGSWFLWRPVAHIENPCFVHFKDPLKCSKQGVVLYFITNPSPATSLWVSLKLPQLLLDQLQNPQDHNHDLVQIGCSLVWLPVMILACLWGLMLQCEDTQWMFHASWQCVARWRS